MMREKRIILYVLVATLAFGFGLRVWNLSGPDMAVDDALYSFRSVGYVDYVAATNRQTTPVIWFPQPQWWQYLSFHDGPPLGFMAQWLFFRIGGDNLWAARLPFVAAGVLSIFAVFLLGRLIGGAWVGIASAGAIAVMNYAVWFSRIGNLDGFLVPWIALSIYFFLKAKERPTHYVWWGACVGAGLATKYTFLFLGPLFAVMLIFWHRGAFRQRWFWVGCGVLLLLVSPIIVYNVMMWQARGHPDAALSTLFGQHPEDFYGLARKTRIHFNFIAEGASILSRNFSPGFILLFLLGLAAASYKFWKERRCRPYCFMLGFSIFLALAMLTAVGGGDRFGAILIPFGSLIIGIGIMQLLAAVGGRKCALLLVVIAAAGMGELFFTAQTQWTSAPFIQSRYLVALNRPIFAGYNALDQYVRHFYQTFPGAPHVILFTKGTQLAMYQEQRTLARFKRQPKLGPQTHLLLFDDRMNWFAGVWIFERRRLYEASPIHPIGQFIRENPDFYKRFGFKDVTIITADERILPADEDFLRDPRTMFVKELEVSQQPIEEIRNPAGEVVFRVFRLPLAS